MGNDGVHIDRDHLEKDPYDGKDDGMEGGFKGHNDAFDGYEGTFDATTEFQGQREDGDDEDKGNIDEVEGGVDGVEGGFVRPPIGIKGNHEGGFNGGQGEFNGEGKFVGEGKQMVRANWVLKVQLMDLMDVKKEANVPWDIFRVHCSMARDKM